ncbi:DNA polymerase III subunit gamma and tau [Sinomonas sp. ASV322]|uniref:DNA polymerase III subunit gamma and tau n=1 Tax=Sinomonas sp. ASV322 TaxID=3041920 RepID=UPI0027DB4FA1|nr:DNA polymerase III subunit gamma and tau [Sinomonas sp. ASV322]MDQ4502940.1 DNA polymerase III subunit gamma and tau [Sinomonas sp. ASV322]
MSSPTALYRRYRPDTFQDVIGQEHVTEPLMTALRKDRVNHAYLFSGPRGCGKTTSARILARCLNCEKGPTPEPCGVCPSCVELARGGSGSLDVIEIDAASHGGVDDARDLRERATFAPVRDRYKIFIIDEAHMVTSAGFNALLKIVEEPPEHIKFIFATTEPDKVIGTIRSRTHHYPFRLVPPEPLMAYLEQLCSAEHVPVEPGVLSLVVRAGGGSVRDSLSVLDQLMAGAGTGGIDYELAVALLGYTHAALLDDVVDAVAAGDSGTVFRAVDRVVQTGHDPRRFVEDLLERFRDLIIVRALPDAAESILRGVPADQLARMRTQAQSIGAAELSRAADVTSAAFNEMTGATSPRLHLELLCARLMLPAADGDHGIAARLDRLERRLAFEHAGPESGTAATSTPATMPADGPAASAPATPGPAAPAAEPAASASAAPAPLTAATPAARVAAPASSAARTPAPATPSPSTGSPVQAAGAGQAQPAAAPREAAPEAPQPAPMGSPAASQAPNSPGGGSAGGGTGSVEMFRRAWPEILEKLTSIKRLTWILVSQNATIAGFDGRTLTLAFANSGSAGSFTRGDHSDNVRRAVQQVLGVDVQIDATTGGNGPTPAAARGAEPGPKAPAEPPQSPRTPENSAGAPAPEPIGQLVAPSAADVAWGLAPAPAPAPAQDASEQARPAFDQSNPPSTQHSRAAAQAEAASAQAAATPARAEQPVIAPPASSELAALAPAPASQAQEPRVAPTTSASGTGTDDPYADIPYADDEPPAEWDEPLPEDEGWRRPSSSGRTPHPGPAGAPAGAGSPPRDATSPRTGQSPSSDESRGSRSPGQGKTAEDPWSYARESAPGVWTVGTESNVGSGTTAAGRPGASPAEAPYAEAPSAREVASPSYAPAAAQQPSESALEGPAEERPSPQAPDHGGRPLSMYQRLSQKAAQERGNDVAAPRPQRPAPSQPVVEDIPSADDETVEASGVFGRAAVERILGGKLIEERAHDGTVIPPR